MASTFGIEAANRVIINVSFTFCKFIFYILKSNLISFFIFRVKIGNKASI
jgi:hypothetical protein